MPFTVGDYRESVGEWHGGTPVVGNLCFCQGLNWLDLMRVQKLLPPLVFRDAANACSAVLFDRAGAGCADAFPPILLNAGGLLALFMFGFISRPFLLVKCRSAHTCPWCIGSL